MSSSVCVHILAWCIFVFVYKHFDQNLLIFILPDYQPKSCNNFPTNTCKSYMCPACVLINVLLNVSNQ